MSSHDLYYMPASTPSRAILMLARELEIELNLKVLDITKKENMKPEFLKINPQHCIPTLVNNETGFVLWESRAILIYLVEKFAPEGHSLYPKDIEKRSRINQRLLFDNEMAALGKALFKPIYKEGKPLDKDIDKVFREKLAWIELFLSDSNFIAGDDLTVADLSLFAALGVMDAIDYDFADFPKLAVWRLRVAESIKSHAEVNVQPLKDLKALIDERRAKYAAL